MKKITTNLLATVLAGQLYAQGQLAKNQQAAQEAIIKMFNALSSRDSVGLKAYCTADIALYEYGQVWNIDTLIMKAIVLNQATDFKRINSFDFINTKVDKTMAWVTYRLESVFTRDGKKETVRWLETLILVKEKKQWKVKHLHSTVINRS